MMTTQSTVATLSPTQADMIQRALLPRTLMGGTAAMRGAGELYLPREEAESRDAYNARLQRTTLFNAFGKTVEDMTGKVFSKPITLKEDMPDRLRDFAENIDLTGRHLNVFARDVLQDILVPGVGYILVDMPPAVTSATGRPVTLADEQAAGIRPYFVYIPVERLIGWRAVTVGGVQTLVQVRIRETVTEPDGPFGETVIEQIRVLEPGSWTVWRKQEADWIIYDSGTTSLQKITLVPVYAKRTGFMTGEPPLEKLAELNVAHWQSSSDQRNILHTARVPILFGAGLSEDTKFIVGAATMIRSSDSTATLSYVEHTGAAIGAGDKDIQNLEMQMQAMGLQLLVSHPGPNTATGEMRDDAKENSPLAMIARGLGDALEQAFGYAAEYISLGRDAGGQIDVNTDFGIAAGAAQAIPNIIAAQSAGLISRETAWAEMQRRGFLADDFDPEAEQTRIEAEDAAQMTAAEGMDI